MLVRDERVEFGRGRGFRGETPPSDCEYMPGGWPGEAGGGARVGEVRLLVPVVIGREGEVLMRLSVWKLVL